MLQKVWYTFGRIAVHSFCSCKTVLKTVYICLWSKRITCTAFPKCQWVSLAFLIFQLFSFDIWVCNSDLYLSFPSSVVEIWHLNKTSDKLCAIRPNWKKKKRGLWNKTLWLLDTNGENEQMCKENTGNMIKSKSQVSKSSVQKKKKYQINRNFRVFVCRRA